MTDKTLIEVHILMRKRFNLLTEVFQLTQQMGDSIDRKDQVTMVSFMEERQEALRQLSLIREDVNEYLAQESQKDRIHLKKILAGKVSTNSKEEALKNQVLSSKELLRKIVELDKRLNQRVAGKDSMYNRI